MAELRTLRLALNGQDFDAVKAGEKVEVLRIVDRHWTSRLVGRTYDSIILTRYPRYPKAEVASRHLSVPWRGYTRTTITDLGFGADPVEAFAVVVSLQAAPWNKGLAAA